MKPITNEKEYYDDSEYISFSGLKLFSKCPTLYKEVYKDKTLKQEDHDYFVYGKVVDALITESPEYFKEHFMVVSRTVDPEKKLSLEVKLKDAQAEYKKRGEILAKNPNNKTALKGEASWAEKIGEIEKQIYEINNIGDKIQVTTSIYENAIATAEAIKADPVIKYFYFSPETCQKILVTENLFGKYKGKGKLDYLYLEGAGDISVDGVQGKFVAATIADVKTCRSIKDLELDNTHYKGQLAFYRELIHRVYNIPKDKISCYIIAGDKQTGKLKNAQIMEYDSELLDEMDPILEAWTQKLFTACTNNVFMSARELEGNKQQCFTCSSCRTAPLSKDGGILKIDKALIQSQKQNDSHSPTVFIDEELEY